MQCLYRKFLQKGQFVFQHETGGEHPNAAPKGKPDRPSDKSTDKTSKMIANALTTCSEFSCSVEMPEKPWQQEADQILEKIQQDPGFRVAFNTFLKEYARVFGQDAFETTEDVASNFYAALGISGVPDSAVGFNTAWNDIVHIAEKGVAEIKSKWPYERLKAAIDGVRNKGKPTQIAQK